MKVEGCEGGRLRRRWKRVVFVTCCNGSVGGDARHCDCVTGNVVLEP